jgi:hypothetical protein
MLTSSEKQKQKWLRLLVNPLAFIDPLTVYVYRLCQWSEFGLVASMTYGAWDFANVQILVEGAPNAGFMLAERARKDCIKL